MIDYSGQVSPITATTGALVCLLRRGSIVSFFLICVYNSSLSLTYFYTLVKFRFYLAYTFDIRSVVLCYLLLLFSF